MSQWRTEVLTLTTRILFVLSLFMLIPSLSIALSLREFWRLLIDVPIVVLLGVISCVPRLGFGLRTTVLLGLLYGASLFWLILSGLVGSGRLYFVLLIALAALLLNLRGTMLVYLLALLSIAAIFWGFAAALLPLPLAIVDRMFAPATLMAHWLAEVAVSGVIVAAIVLTINRLQGSFRATEEARVTLQGLNEQLEQRVAERTAALMQANEHLQAEITERKQTEESLRESERFVQQIAGTIPDILYIYDLNLERNVYSNRQLADILGYTPQEVQAMGQELMPTLLHPDDWPHVMAHRGVQMQAAEGDIITLEYRMRSRAGSWRCLHSREVVFTRTADGQPQQILGIAHDITEHKQAEEALRQSEQRLKAIFDNAAVGIGLTDNAGRSIIANARGAQQLGYTPEELAQRSNLELTHPDDRAATVERMQQLVRGEIQGYRIEKRYFRKDGSIFWADLSVSAVYDDDGQIAYLLGIVVDITERKQLEQQLHQANMLLQEQALRDPLTGLHNRRYLDEALPREIHRAERHNMSIGIIMIDIDHFKRFNDTYGHDAGDTLLQAVSAFLQRITRGEDIVCRYGGEEFILVLPGASHEDACQRADEICAGIRELVATHQGQILDVVTGSLGIALFRSHGTTADALVRAADQALYQAKHGGRNRVVVADSINL